MSDTVPDMSPALHLFEGFGVELEYMIVDRADFRIRPIADRILVDDGGAVTGELEQGALSWSNELVLHVIELKTNGPAAALEGLDTDFHNDVLRINGALSREGACLMPSAAHPLMNPFLETRLWPHDNSDIYEAFNRIFNCRGHGWSNLQSAHLNLPFDGDEEFARLHGAIRLVLPVIPAMAAASPYLEGGETGYLDTRLEMYRKNCSKIFSVTGHVVPEPVRGMEDYRETILNRIYDELAPWDPDGILRHEWVNARGAIARFERSTIEIRVVDVQECPKSDLALACAVSLIVRRLTDDPGALRRGAGLKEDRLASVLLDTIRDGELAVISDAEYLACLGFAEKKLQALEMWYGLIESLRDIPDAERRVLEAILKNGTLASRMKRITGRCSRGALQEMCGILCACLEENRLLIP